MEKDLEELIKNIKCFCDEYNNQEYHCCYQKSQFTAYEENADVRQIVLKIERR